MGCVKDSHVWEIRVQECTKMTADGDERKKNTHLEPTTHHLGYMRR